MATSPLSKHELFCKALAGQNFNITEEFNLFCKDLIEYHLPKTPNITNNATSQTPVDHCAAYCDHNGMRSFLEDYKYYHHGYATLIICIFGTIANILNIIILTRKEMSKTPINSILKWLAVCDMFVMVEYIPYTCHQYIVKGGEKDLSFTWSWFLLLHSCYTTTLHTISILLTVTLAIWRYIAIKHPHGTLGHCAQNHYGRAIFLCFVLSPILCMSTYLAYSVVPITEMNVTEYHLDLMEETQLYKVNFWIHSVIIKLLPCIILTVISFVLIDVLCRASKRKLKLKGYDAANTNNIKNHPHKPSKIDRRADRTTMLLVAVLLLFLITEFPQGILGLLSGIMGKCFLTRCYILFGEIMDLLALINAAVGFVLYGSMSKQFRATFKSTFCKKHSQRIETTRVTNINHTTTNV